MSKRKQVRNHSAIQFLAVLVPALAALPAAYFVGRSTYYYLILRWFENHVLFWPGLGVVIAVVAGLVVEGLGTVSLFLWSSFRRWNKVKAVRFDAKAKEWVLKGGYDKAPEYLALVALVGYVIAVVVMLLVLEWKPEAARFAPVMFPVLTVVGGLCWAMYDQHRDRLAYHGLSWNWVALPAKADTVQAGQDSERDKWDNEQDKPTVSRPMVNLDDLDRAILRCLTDWPDLSGRALARTVGGPRSTVASRIQSKLEPAGLLVREGDQWTVHWSDNGKHA